MSKIKILIVQNSPKIGQKSRNLADVEKMLDAHNGEKFDLVVFPELFAIGWYPEVFRDNVETADNSITLEFLKSVAKRFNSNVIGGSYVFKESDEIYRNACPFIDRNGNVLAHYFKAHLFSHFIYNEGKYLTAGERGVVVNSDIGKIGLSICYDIRFPELFRAYAYAGVDMMVEVAAWPKYRENHWKTLTKARAIENQSFMISVSQCGHIFDDEWNLGHSMVVAPYGEVLSIADFDSCTKVVEIDIDEARQLKDNFPILKDRKELPYLVNVVSCNKSEL